MTKQLSELMDHGCRRRLFFIVSVILIWTAHQAGAQSVNYFYEDLSVSSGSYITASEASEFHLFAGFINQSSMASQWSTDTAFLFFKMMTTSDHSVYLPGRDDGPKPAGYVNNYAWKGITIEPGNSLTLHDGNASPGAAQYVKVLTGVLAAGSLVTNITGNGLNIYYAADLTGNDYLGGQTYDLTGGGHLIPVAPFCDGSDIDLDGICDTEDNCPYEWNPDQADGDSDGHGDLCPLADYDDDLDVDGSDLLAFAGYYSAENPEADIHEDSRLDLLDIEKFAREFGWAH